MLSLQRLLIPLMLVAVVFAGCADSAPVEEVDDIDQKVAATSTTGGIRGVVVDQSIVPIEGATVSVDGSETSTTTGADGVFVFSGLKPGTYFVTATHPFYDTIQTQANVEAGVEDPPSVRIQLTRLINTEPSINTEMFRGYISCSSNIGGLLLSEECGEGVGVPCEVPFVGVPIPVVGCQRWGGNPDNLAQIDFYVQSKDAKTIQAEVSWEPSISVGTGSGSFNMGIYTDFNCLPSCDWSAMYDNKDGVSPLTLRTDDGNSGTEGFFGPDDPFMDVAEFDENTKFSTFTWADSDEHGILLEQYFDMYVTTSYVLPLPDTWSYINGDESPF